MTSSSLDRTMAVPERDREPGLAVFAVGAAIVAQIMPGMSAWWLAPGLAAGTAALVAATRLLYRRGRVLERAWLRELSLALAFLGVAGLIGLVARSGPQHRLWVWSLAVTAAFVALSGIGVFFTALQTRAQEGSGEAGPTAGRDPGTRRVVTITVVGVVLTVALLVAQAVTR